MDNGYLRAIANRRTSVPFEFATAYSEFADISIAPFEFASGHSEFAAALTEYPFLLDDVLVVQNARKTPV